MARATKQAAWISLWNEINHITFLDTKLDDERSQTVNELIESVQKIQDSGDLSIEQIYSLADVINLSFKSGISKGQ